MTKAKLAMIEKNARNMSMPNVLGVWMTKIRTDDVTWMIARVKENEELAVALRDARKEIYVLESKLGGKQ